MTTAPARTAPARQGLIARRPLVSFFVMAYAFSWLVWSPWVLGKDGAGLLPFQFGQVATVVVLAAGILAGPTLSAFITTAATEGREGVRRLLARYVLWRVGIRWYLFALIGVPAIMLLGTMAYSGRMPSLGEPSYLLFYLGGFVLTLFLGDRCWRKVAGGASRFPAWSGCTGRSLRRLSWARCGPCGTYPSSWSRPGPPHLAVAAELQPVGQGPTGTSREVEQEEGRQGCSVALRLRHSAEIVAGEGRNGANGTF